ncbi:MAG: hypothetical protein M3Y70_08410 [Pseudomonadota bacterium]|nr:hypothetical protein [Pseudomonadota bacterium]
MNTPLLAAALVAAIATVIPATLPANAGTTTTLQRCRAPDGSVGYTDRSCAIFGAGSTLETSEVIADIDWGDYSNGDSWSRAGTGRRSPASGCARSPTQLATDLYGALALGDVNRVAESYHFAGMSSSAGRATMNRLERLLGHEVLDSQSFGTANLQLLLADSGGGASAVDFDIHRYAGCYFVSF